MKLLINPGGGMSGDMFSAALIASGARSDIMKESMCAAGELLGSVNIEAQSIDQGVMRLLIHLESKRKHLASDEGRTILTHLFDRFGIKEEFRNFGMNVFDILVKAEKRAHKEFNIHIEGDHIDKKDHHHEHHIADHKHDHKHDHDHRHDHHHEHHHNHHHNHDDHHHTHNNHHNHDLEESFLHEAQDIVIDIMGAVTGLQELGVQPRAFLTCPVSVGGGHVHCSHGMLSIPAPATTVIIEEYNIPWKKGPIEKELFTPTGAAILAALDSHLIAPGEFDKLNVRASGKSRGTKTLDIPPLELVIYS